jgi:hypothetical protein
MTEDDSYHVEPPYYQLDEALNWIEFAQIPEQERDGWWSMLDTIKLLEDALHRGKLRAYASLDASPIQAIDQWTWVEFDIHPHSSNGEIIRRKSGGSIEGFVVRSFKTYRAAALRDLSQPAVGDVPGTGGREPGFCRVMDQVMFEEAAIRQLFPKTTDTAEGLEVATDLRTKPANKYARALKEIEGGRSFLDSAPHSQADIARLVEDLWIVQKVRARPSFSTIQRNVSRHYGNFRDSGR